MSDGESTMPTPRKRPTYGRPGPVAPGSGPTTGAGGAPQAPDSTGSPYTSAPSYPPYDAGTSTGPGNFSPVTGPLPARPSPQPKRRGLWPLIIGLVLLVIVGPAATIGGIAWSVSSFSADAASGPTVLEASTGEVEVQGNEMIILYVPAADAEAAQCTAEGAEPAAVSTVPTSGATTFGDGSKYQQVLGVVSTEDTTVTISCTGTEAPAYLGPYSLFGVAAPMLIGPLIGVVTGLIGLVLTIVGIVLLVRSRRA